MLILKTLKNKQTIFAAVSRWEMNDTKTHVRQTCPIRRRAATNFFCYIMKQLRF